MKPFEDSKTPEAGQSASLAVAPGSASGNTTIRIALTLEYDPAIMHGDDEDAKAWFFDSILQPGDLFLHSNEIGDVVGEIKSIEILPNSTIGTMLDRQEVFSLSWIFNEKIRD